MALSPLFFHVSPLLPLSLSQREDVKQVLDKGVDQRVEAHIGSWLPGTDDGSGSENDSNESFSSEGGEGQDVDAGAGGSAAVEERQGGGATPGFQAYFGGAGDQEGEGEGGLADSGGAADAGGAGAGPATPSADGAVGEDAEDAEEEDEGDIRVERADSLSLLPITGGGPPDRSSSPKSPPQEQRKDRRASSVRCDCGCAIAAVSCPAVQREAAHPPPSAALLQLTDSFFLDRYSVCAGWG